MPIKPKYVLPFLALALGSCASVSISPTSNPDCAEGIVYFEPAPHLVLSESAKDKSRTASILMLPDRGRARQITWSSGLFGTVKPKVTLTDGWMLGSVESEITQGFTEVVKAIAESALLVDDTRKPGIYPLRWTPETETTPGTWSVDWDRPVMGGV